MILVVPGLARAQGWHFTDVTAAAGLVYEHGNTMPADTFARLHAGGVAAGDYDGDGFVDLYAVRGNAGANLLFRNRGDGTFEEVGASAGVAISGADGSGPTFADYDGDGHLDLLVLGVQGSPVKLFRNLGNGTFADVTAASGLVFTRNSVSAAFGDYDRDGDLDLFVTHWANTVLPGGPREHLWRNQGNGTFTEVGLAAGIVIENAAGAPEPSFDFTFTPNFADLDDDGWPDIAVAADFRTSQVFHNKGDGTFVDVTERSVITDEDGMGGAICDYDNDGDLDWFVSSIDDRPFGTTGNRLYRNRGDGTFQDATDAAGVRAGYWGWGSTFADLDNDGHADLFHVNGYGNVNFPGFAVWQDDPARLFVADGDGTFTERSAELGVDDRGRGLGVVAFDYDRDGDLDLFIANTEGAPKLFRNDGGNASNHLTVRVDGQAANSEGIGARITVAAGGTVQMRELRAGSNFVSQDPAEAHFGLGAATVADSVRVRWLRGGSTTLSNVAANQVLVVSEPAAGLCGNGVVDSASGYAEDCDLGAANGTPGSCCLVTCTFATAARVCRAAAGACDAAETCTGISDVCPAADLKSTAVCRPAAGACDLPETCDGVADTCPATDVKSSGECRPVAGDCDVPETCDGVANACPPDVVAPEAVVCRPSDGVCDVAETCDGIAPACPADDVEPNTVVCRGAGDLCDAAEHCDGAGVDCPPDVVAASGIVCRGAAGPCDVAEACDGIASACPADQLTPGGTPCPGDAGECAEEALCSGLAAACPAQDFRPAGAACGDDGNPCTLDECDGAGTCSHLAGNAGATCRESAGVCDVAEMCDGILPGCPLDQFGSPLLECRPEAGPCDVAEQCTGDSAACPSDALAPPTQECRGAGGVCDVAEHCSGDAVDCPGDELAGPDTVCRPSAGECDAPETCSGADTGCSADLVLPDGTACADGILCTTSICQDGACIGTSDPGCQYDDFQCYRARALAGSLPFSPERDLILSDAFESGLFDALRVRHVCSPAADGGTLVADPAIHLESYQAKAASGEPRHVPRTNLLVSNRLGSLRVDTRKADLLMVPTAVDAATTPAAPTPGDHDVDRFKCWQIKVSKGTPKLAKGLSLVVDDGFTDGPVIYRVKAARHLCLPVGQDGEGVIHSRRALLCYAAKVASGQPRLQPGNLFIANQFGSETLDAGKEEELCLSSEIELGQGGGHSVARQWNEEILDAIRLDTPRPTVHARNLFHLSAAMWDAWRAYGGGGSSVFVDESHASLTPDADRAVAMSFAAYRVLSHRYAASHGAAQSQAAFDARMAELGLDPSYDSVVGDEPAAVGNRIAAAIIAFGQTDGSNEAGNYSDSSYVPQNVPLIVKLPGTTMAAPNSWQPLALDHQVSQNGIPIPGSVQQAIGMRWNEVAPFALTRSDPEALYVDPGTPPRLSTPTEAEFKAQAVEVIQRSSEQTPDDGVLIDISPGAIGNNPLGSNDGTGYAVNPATGQPYAPQIVKRGDFGRVLAEFWADGPHSETPPGHWNTLANYVTDLLPQKRIGGSGPVVSDLEWDVKLYLALNGAVHDAAIVAWGTKRHYDSVRPISMIRYMGGLGQSSDPGGPSYHPQGLPLLPGVIEVITAESSAPGERHEALAAFVGEIAVLAWPGEPADPATQYQGVRWMRAVEWVAYQRKTFVTPAFAGYTSGHSTFSRSAAEVLTLFTGSPYFPGGLGEFVAEANAYLVFERGPSAEVRLQWATYYDAADQAGQSRLWGGIHIRADDFLGRVTGSVVGIGAFEYAMELFGTTP